MFEYIDKILSGDAREILKQLPDGCISACVTSPPYFNKRLYGTVPLLWGGDPECQHDFTLPTIGGDFRTNKPGKTTTVGANKAMAEWAEVKHGNEYRNHLEPLASGYSQGVASGIKHKPGETNPGKEAWYNDNGGLEQNTSLPEAYCSKCGCWRGSLGNESSIELFIANLVSIFDEVWRVLRADGSCCVNIARAVLI